MPRPASERPCPARGGPPPCYALLPFPADLRVYPQAEKGHGDAPRVLCRARHSGGVVEHGPRSPQLSLEKKQDAQPAEREGPSPGVGSFSRRASYQLFQEAPTLGVV